MSTRLLPLGLVLALLLVAGCQKNESSVPAAIATQYREQLLAPSAQTEASSVSDVRAQLAESPESNAPLPVVIAGTIGKMPNPFHEEKQHPQFPWVEGAASFFLVDDATVAEFEKHGHAKGEECSFCLDMAGRRADKVALVDIRDQDGQPLPYRADALLGLEEGDRLVIEGSASLIMGTMLVVTPQSISVRPAAANEPGALVDTPAQTDASPASSE